MDFLLGLALFFFGPVESGGYVYRVSISLQLNMWRVQDFLTQNLIPVDCLVWLCFISPLIPLLSGGRIS